MNHELTTSIELLQRRLLLMRELAGSLEQSQTAVVRSDVDGMDGQTVRQRDLCEALRCLEIEALESSSPHPIAGEPRKRQIWIQVPEHAVSPGVRQRCKGLAEELVEVEMRVRQLNQVYGALLRRAQRTLQIFMRALSSSANTYAPPKCVPAIAQSSLQEVSHV
jgi:hypothetical protein